MMKLGVFFLIVLVLQLSSGADPLCDLPLEIGLCRAYLLRYGFNTTLNACKEFIYGGCMGNANNFESLEKCQAVCGSGTNNSEDTNVGKQTVC